MLTRAGCRAADKNAINKFQIPGIVLMENAGRGCAEHLIELAHQESDKSAFVVLCGPGNNGGDGFVIARHLYIAGHQVQVVLFQRPEDYSGDARTNLWSLSRLRMTIIEADSNWSDDRLEVVLSSVGRRPTTWIVDALLGTGATGEPRKPLANAIKLSNQLDCRRMAVDIPTGLDCDTGTPSRTTFQADVTCTFIDQKVGFANPAAQLFLGEVVVIGIGAPDEITR